jgi:hypothetical protein
MIDLPDFGTSLSRIAGSAEKLAGLKPGEGAVDLTRQPPAATAHAAESHDDRPEAAGDGATAPPSTKPSIVPAQKKEPLHA